MEKETKLHIAETIKAQRVTLNTIRQGLLLAMNELDDLEMYVRSQVEETPEEKLEEEQSMVRQTL